MTPGQRDAAIDWERRMDLLFQAIPYVLLPLATLLVLLTSHAPPAELLQTCGIALGALAALAAVLVSGVFDHYFFTYPHEFALLWIVLGLGVAAARVAEAEATASGAVRAGG